MKPLSPQQLDHILKKIRDIPSLPEVVHKIINKLNVPGTPASEVAMLISYDPGLSTRVLRMVNSAAFGVPKQITSIQHAIMILGLGNTRGLVVSASIFRLFERRGNPEAQRNFWEHSLATALSSRVLSNFYEFTTPEETFSVALLHDVGKMVLEMVFEEVLPEDPDMPPVGHQRMLQTLEAEQYHYGITHTELGLQLAQKWKLPLSLTEVIQYHHHPQKATFSQPLVFWVAFANQLAHVVLFLKQWEDIGADAPVTELLPLFDPTVVEYFELTEERLWQLATALREEMARTGNWLQLFTQNT
jgi:putative nucleotidyltransferase with HDIG domain